MTKRGGQQRQQRAATRGTQQGTPRSGPRRARPAPPARVVQPTAKTSTPSSPRAGAARPAPWAYFALYFLAAAALHGVNLWLQENHRSLGMIIVIAERYWIGHAALLATVLLVRLVPAYGRSAALVAGLAVTATSMAPAWSLALLGFCLAVFGISRLRLNYFLRLLLVLVASAVVPCLRWGLLGPEIAGYFTDIRAHGLWMMLMMRSFLYQAEAGRLRPGDRGFLEFLGSFAVVPLTGGGSAPPFPYHRFLGEYGRDHGERTMRLGVGLLALGTGYALLNSFVIKPLSIDVTLALARASREGSLALALQEHGRLTVALALALHHPFRYFAIATGGFLIVGNLRLLGFNLGSGFNRPYLSSSFVEYWKRWNYFYREAAITILFFPLMGMLRDRLKLRVALTIATAGAFTVLIVTHGFLESLSAMARPLEAVPRLLNGMFSYLSIAICTVASTYRWGSGARVAAESVWRRGLRIALVIIIAAFMMTVWHLRVAGLPWDGVVTVFRFAVGV